MKNPFRIFVGICFIILIGNCGDSNLSPAAASIINEASTANAEELLVEIEIISNVSSDRYIVVDSIKNIVVEINNDIWGVFEYFNENQGSFDNLIEIFKFGLREILGLFILISINFNFF